jgi:hypothetical protein
LPCRAGHDVTALDLAQRGTLQLHFGIGPNETLPALDAPADEAASASVQGVALRSAAAMVRQPDFAEALASGEIGFGGEQVFVADIASGDRHLRDLLLPYAMLEICPLTATAECLMMLPAVNDGGLAKTCFVMSMVEDTRRFARHSVGFLRELLGDRLLGQVRRDEAVIEAGAMLQPLGRYAPHSAALADTIGPGRRTAGRNRWRRPGSMTCVTRKTRRRAGRVWIRPAHDRKPERPRRMIALLRNPANLLRLGTFMVLALTALVVIGVPLDLKQQWLLAAARSWA